MTKGGILVHQAVHGYVGGHRELWSSVRLKPRDTQTVLVYSDTSSSGLRIGEHGYLTGYPLPESGYYALARTWPAPEMQRPGAVWTHTLFVEFAKVAKLQDATALLPLFRRPSSDGDSSVEGVKSAALEVVSANPSAVAFDSENDEAWYRQILAHLYGPAGERVVATAPIEDASRVEWYVLALWSQQWPRLRRAFRFCTLTSGDRSTEKAAFDLQIVPDSERGIRSRFAGAVVVQGAPSSTASWIDHLVSDLKRPMTSGLRDFFQRTGADLTAGRRAVAPLVRLHVLLNFTSRSASAWNEAFALVEEITESTPSTVTQIVVTAALRCASMLDPSGLDYVLSNLESIDAQELLRNAATLGIAVWQVSPSRLVNLYETGGRGRDVAEAGLAVLDLDVLITGLPSAENLIDIAFALRPELLTSPNIWRANPALASHALRAAAQIPEVWPAVLDRLIAGQETSIIDKAFEAFGDEVVWERLAVTLLERRTSEEALAPWLHAGVRYPGTVAHILASTHGLDRWALRALARVTSPDLVPNDFGDDPWVIATLSANDHASITADSYLGCYFLARALGHRSRNTIALVELAFSGVYRAVATDSLPQDAWLLLEPRLPSANHWQPWDRCQRLLAGIGRLYVRRNLSAASFSRLGRDDAEFSGLVVAAANEWGGRSYLRCVKHELTVSHYEDSHRLRIVDDGIGSWF